MTPEAEALDAKPWRGACPACPDRVWCTDTEEEARDLVLDHIADVHQIGAITWRHEGIWK